MAALNAEMAAAAAKAERSVSPSPVQAAIGQIGQLSNAPRPTVRQAPDRHCCHCCALMLLPDATAGH